MGVIEAPRVQLTHGLFRTIEKPTSLPTAAPKYPWRRNANSFIPGGSAKGRWRTNTDLTPIYGWFTEGFDTPVLRDAKTLLDELN